MVLQITKVEFTQNHDCEDIKEADTINDPFVKFLHNNEVYRVDKKEQFDRHATFEKVFTL